MASTTGDGVNDFFPDGARAVVNLTASETENSHASGDHEFVALFIALSQFLCAIVKFEAIALDGEYLPLAKRQMHVEHKICAIVADMTLGIADDPVPAHEALLAVNIFAPEDCQTINLKAPELGG